MKKIDTFKKAAKELVQKIWDEDIGTKQSAKMVNGLVEKYSKITGYTAENLLNVYADISAEFMLNA